MPTLVEPQPTNAEARLAQRLRAVEQRLAELESRAAAVPVVAGNPGAATIPVTVVGREGSLAGDTANTRLWLKLNGTWRYVTLT